VPSGKLSGSVIAKIFGSLAAPFISRAAWVQRL
jgi:hypothetical protein